MILSLDHWIFGNGWGLRSPFNDNKFFWLDGRLYTFGHGLGAQLTSIQWLHPRAGQRRRLNGREYVVFHSRRRFCRVMVKWALVGLPPDLNAAHTLLREIERELNDLRPPHEAVSPRSSSADRGTR